MDAEKQTTPRRPINIECPGCGKTYADWTLDSSNREDFDLDEDDDDDESPSSICPECGHYADHARLIEEDGCLKDPGRFAKKPRACPSCGHTPIASIMYGMPALSDTLNRDLNEGRIVLGGCCVSDDDPSWACSACNKVFYKQEKH